MIAAQQRIEAMKRLMLAAREFTGWEELTPAKGAILEELQVRVARCLDGHAADGNYNWLVWIRPKETVEEFVHGTQAAHALMARNRAIRERKREFARECLWNGTGHWTFGCDSNPRRITIADEPGRILAMAERRRYGRLMDRHGDALASVLQVLRHR